MNDCHEKMKKILAAFVFGGMVIGCIYIVVLLGTILIASKEGRFD